MSETSNKFEVSPSLSILIAGVLIAGAIIFVNRNPAPAAGAADNTNAGQQAAAVHIPAPSASDHIIGSPNAPIVLVEYSDLQCPYCTMVYPTLKRIVSESNGQIAWVYRYFPLESIHPQAKPSALAAECIADELGNDAFWKFVDIIFANQSKMSPAYYAQIAASLGSNAQTFATCIASPATAAKVDAESADAQANGGQGTPYTVVYGNNTEAPVSGAVPYAQFMGVIKAVQNRQ